MDPATIFISNRKSFDEYWTPTSLINIFLHDGQELFDGVKVWRSRELGNESFFGGIPGQMAHQNGKLTRHRTNSYFS